MKTERTERKNSPWWAASVAGALVAAPVVGWAFGVSLPGLVLGGILAALGLRLAVIADAVRGPEAEGALPAAARRPERLHTARV